MKNLMGLSLLCLITFLSCKNSGDSSSSMGADGDTTRMTIEGLNRQIASEPSKATLYNKRATYYVLEQQFDKALNDIHKAIELDGEQPAFYITLSEIYLLMGKPDNSRDALLKAIDKNPANIEALNKLAKLYLIVKDYRNCYLTVKEILSLDVGNPTAYFTRAIGLLEQGDTIPAVDDLKKAVDSNQEFYEAYVQLGELYAVRRDPIAELYFRNALKLWPDSREALYMLGLHYQETGKYDQAIETYQRLSVTDTTSRDAWYNTGYIYLVYLNNYSLAVKFFSEAIRKDSAFHEAWYNRGFAYELSGDYPRAAADYKQSLKVKVNYDKGIEGLNRLDQLKLKK